MDFKGGEPAALARLQHYLWGSDAIASYFDTRNGMIKADDSTKFSPWLALGCISPRTIYAVRTNSLFGRATTFEGSGIRNPKTEP